MEILIRTQHVLEFFTEILQEQQENKKFFCGLIYSHHPFLPDIDKFRLLVLNIKKEDSPYITNTLYEIFKRANANISLYEDLLNLQGEGLFPIEKSTWLIHEPWDAEKLVPNDVNGKDMILSSAELSEQIENHHLFDFCLKISASLKSMFLGEEHPWIFRPLEEFEKLTIPKVTFDKENLLPVEIEYSSLYDSFTDPEKYQRVMNLLVNKELCNSGNYNWKASKEILIGVLKQLHLQGYLHRKLTQKEMITICRNTFAIEVKIRTCNIKPEDVLLPDIPLASTL
jgi:hypothetical protein